MKNYLTKSDKEKIPLLCRIFYHKWIFVKKSGGNFYYRCKRCDSRKYKCNGGYTPIDKNFLNKGEDIIINIDKITSELNEIFNDHNIEINNYDSTDVMYITIDKKPLYVFWSDLTEDNDFPEISIEDEIIKNLTKQIKNNRISSEV